MSFWTYPRVILQVSTYEEIPSRFFKKIVKEMLSKAPAITGSEGNATVLPFLFVKGTMSWSRGKTVELYDRFQIVISGNLRDRYNEDTLKEVNAFIKFIRNYETDILPVEHKHLFFVDVDIKNIGGFKLKDLEKQRNTFNNVN